MKKRWKKIGLIALSTVLALVVLASGGGYWFVKHSLAVTAGELKTGVDKPVRIERDTYGIPHIYAQNERDLWFAQGYVQAQDRMWQMELTRRSISGRLAEVFGPDLVANDRLSRTVGFKRIADDTYEKLDESTKQALQAYANGINSYLDEVGSTLPVEYTIAGFKPEKWTPQDSVSIGKYMAWDLGGNMRTELLFAAGDSKLGRDKLRSLIPDYPTDAPTIVHDSTPDLHLSAEAADQLIGNLSLKGEGGLPGQGLGSNNWVVAGSRTASGKPLLASDMHLYLQNPSNFYQNQLVVPGLYNVTGVIFPGVPGVIVGHNERISWGFTNLPADVQDLYMEKPNPSNPHQFEYNGTYEDAKVIPQEIKVKGEESVKFDTVITRHGPLITELISSYKPENPLALRWLASDYTEEISAMLMFGRAKNWQEFEEGVKRFSVPAQNVVYADVDGNIAYRSMAKIPVRKKGDGLSPVPGWTDEYEWTGFVPFDKLPFAWNPKEGYLASANNKITGDQYPYFFTYEWESPYRVARIGQMIEEKDKLTLDDMQRMQGDWLNLQAEKNLSFMLPILEQGQWNDAEKQALETLKAWVKKPLDDPELVAPSIYHMTYMKSLHKVFEPQMGPLFSSFASTQLPLRAMDDVIQDRNKKWFEGDGQAKQQAITSGFKEAVAALQAEVGQDQSKWKWGTLHTVTFAHSMGNIKPLDLLFNDGPHPQGGSTWTVGAAPYSKLAPFSMVVSAPWRFVIDMADSNAAHESMQLGASGQLGSPHLKDQNELWLNGQYKTMYFTQEDVAKNREATLTLNPK